MTWCCCQCCGHDQSHSWCCVSGCHLCLTDQGHLHHSHCQSLNLSPFFFWGFPHTLNPHCGFHFDSWLWLGYAGSDPDHACHRAPHSWTHDGGHRQQTSGSLCRSCHPFCPDCHHWAQQWPCRCRGNHGHGRRTLPLVRDWLCCLWWGPRGGAGGHRLLSQRSGPCPCPCPCPSWKRTLKILKKCCLHL